MLLARTADPRVSEELHVFDDWASLLNAMAQSRERAEQMRAVHEMVAGVDVWIGAVQDLPSAFEDLRRVASRTWLTFTPAGESFSKPVSPACSGSDSGSDGVCDDGDSLRAVGTVVDSDTEDDASVTSSEPLQRRYWRTVPRSAAHPSTVLAAAPHAYEPKGVRFVMRTLPTGCYGVGYGRRFTYQHRPHDAMARQLVSAAPLQTGIDGVVITADGVVVIPSEADGARIAAACVLGGDYDPETVRSVAFVRVAKPLCALVAFASGPRKRCYVDPECVRHSKPVVGSPVLVAVPCPNENNDGTAEPALRVGHVASVSSWCKRKGGDGQGECRVVRYATPVDVLRNNAAEAASRRLADAAAGFLAYHAVPLQVFSAWTSLDLSSVHIALRRCEKGTAMCHEPGAVVKALQRHLSRHADAATATAVHVSLQESPARRL